MWVDAPFIHEVRAGRNVLRASLHIEVYGGLVQVVGGGHNDVFDLAVRDELPVTIASGGRAALTVELAVRRCIPVAAIDSADPLNVPVEVSRLDRQLTSTAWAQPQSIVQLVELLHRSCDQAGRSVGQKQD